MTRAESARARRFEEIAVGDSYEVRRTFAAQDVDAFAAVSGDFSPLHMEEEYAASTEFGTRVVHGLLLGSLFSQLIGMHLPGKHALYLGQDLAFRKPVLVGETVTAVAKVVGKNEATRTLSLATEIRNADAKVVVSGSAKVKVRSADRVPEAIGAPQQAGVTSAATAAPVALVTGASRGIGAEIARTLSAQGTTVVVNYFHSAERADGVVRDICKGGGQAVAVQADVRSAEDVRRLIDDVLARHGRLDQVVNAATGELRQERFADLDWSAFQDQLDYQLKAVVHVCQAAYPALKRAMGSVVNVLSQVTLGAPPALMADYVAAKHALHGLSKALAAEWATDGIRVNMVSPGLVQTELTQHYHERLFKMEAARTPLRRLAAPADVARAVAFLLGEQSAFLTGVNVPVTGGQVMS